MKDHTVNCEVRILGTRNCTCGAVEENFPTTTTNKSTDVSTLVPRPDSKVAEPAKLKSAPKGDVVAEFINDDVLQITSKKAPKVVIVNGQVFTLLNKA